MGFRPPFVSVSVPCARAAEGLAVASPNPKTHSAANRPVAAGCTTDRFIGSPPRRLRS